MDSHDLFQRYIAVCNQAIIANKDRFPFSHILNAERPVVSVDVCIAGYNAEMNHTIRMENGIVQVAVREEGCVACGCHDKWQVSKAYVDQVISDPKTFINNPALLNWDWMY